MNDESIFTEAVAITDPDQRRAFLDRECQGNDARRREIEKLLAAHMASNPLDQLPKDLANTEIHRESPGEQGSRITEGPGSIIGVYKLMEQIGEGGMGLVFVAEQQKPVRRKVALKVIKPGMDTHQVVARFEAERQALALMDHPHIAKVLDAGTTDAGRPYFVMELVRGVPITQYADAINLPPRERLQLFIQVCQAVQHSHHKGVIHRDLKPSNILVAPHDGVPIVKVIDFGVAKALGQQLTEKTIYTQFSQMIGTPLYMSPEQAEVNQLDVDTRSDIYSLGVLLYELLTGTTPFDRQRFQKAAFDEIRRIIREEEPPRPSTRITSLGATLPSVSAQRGTDPKHLAGLVRGELDWIVMRCLEKDRTRRYDTAVGLAKDVQRFLADETVEARPPSSIYRFQKMARRNKVALTTASLVAAALFLGLGLSMWQAFRATEAERLAIKAEQQAISDRNDKAEALQAESEHRRIAEEEREKAQQERDVAQAAKEDLRRANYAASMSLISAAWQTDNVQRVIKLLEEQKPKPGEKDLRGFEWHYWDRQCHAERWTRKIEGAASGKLSNAIRFSGNGQRLCLFDTAPRVNRFSQPIPPIRMLDVSTGKELSSWECPDSSLKIFLCTSINNDGTRIALLKSNIPIVTNPGGFRQRPVLEPVVRKLLVLDTVGWKEIFSLSGKEVLSENGSLMECFLSPDGKLLAGYFRKSLSRPQSQEDALSLRVATDSLHEIVIWNLSDTKKEPVRIQEQLTSVSDLVFSPDGTRLAGALTSPTDRTEPSSSKLSIWDTSTGETLSSVPTNEFVVEKIAFSPEGTRIAGCSSRKGTGSQSVLAMEGADPIGAIRYGRMLQLFLWVGAEGKELKLHRTEPLEGFSTVSVHQIVFNPDGRRLLLWGPASVVKLIDSDTFADLHQYKGINRMQSASFQPDGNQLVTVGTEVVTTTDNDSSRSSRLSMGTSGERESSILQAWGVPALEQRRSVGPRDWGARSNVSSDDGKRRATYRRANLAPGSSEQVNSLADSTTQEDRTITIRDRDGNEILAFKQHTLIPSNVRFSPDGRFVVSKAFFNTVSGNGEEFVWETETGEIRWSSLSKENTPNLELAVMAVTFSHDSQFVALPGVNEMQIVSTADWKTRFLVGQANFVAFSADSRRLMSHKTMLDRAQSRELRSDAKLWNVETGQIIATLPSEALPPSEKFSSNSRWFTTGTTDWSEVIIWDMLSGTKQCTIRDLIPSGTLDFSPDGSRLIQTGKSFSNIWDPVDGKLLLRIAGITNDGRGFIGRPLSGGQAPSVAFSPDGSRIASVAATGVQAGLGKKAVVKVWDAISGQELLELTTQFESSFRQNLSFSPDGYRLIAISPSTGPFLGREQSWDATPREQSVQP